MSQLPQQSEKRISFGEWFDRVGIAAVCLVGVYVGRRFEAAVDTLDEHRTKFAIIQEHKIIQAAKDLEQDKRLGNLEDLIYIKPQPKRQR